MSNAFDGKEGLFALMDTSNGEIALELFYKETPLTVTNFVGLAEGTLDAAKGNNFYDGLKFHRVISVANGDGQDFMIQGGDPKGTGAGGPGYKFADEIVDGLEFNEPGLLAMANAGPGTNGSQFFITIVPTEWLTGKHTIFGKVINEESQQVVNTLKQGATINSVKIIRNGAEAEKFTATQDDWNAKNAEVKKLNEERAKAKVARRIAEVEEKFAGFEKDSYGIYFKTTKEGTGDKIGSKKSVTVEYRGYLVSGEIFDASAKMENGGHEPLDFITNGGQMIPGFDIMVQDMKLNEVRTIVIPSDYAYGDRGVPQAGIEGGAFIAFDVEVIKAK